MIKVKPMIFNTEMVRALLDERKVQTRRPVKPQPAPFKNWKGWIVESSNRKHEGCASWADGEEGSLRFNPAYAMPPCKAGDLIYVRETFSETDIRPAYLADHDDGIHCVVKRWTPSIHMPRHHSRLTLKVTGVRVERVQDISNADCIAEGFTGGHGSIPGYMYSATPKEHFCDTWQAIYGDSWERNDWVWVIDFDVIRQNVDKYIASLEANA